MPCQDWTAADVEEARRFEYYRSGLCASFARLTPERPDSDKPFDASVRLSQSEKSAFTFMSLPRHKISRTRVDIAEAEDDGLYLNFVLRGQLALDFDNGHRLARANDMVVVDNSRCFDAHVGISGSTRLFVFRLPDFCEGTGSHRLGELLSRHTLAPALSRILTHASRRQYAWDDEEMDEAAAAIEALIKTISRGDEPQEPLRKHHVTLSVARTIIRDCCSNPQFGLENLAIELKMPVRTLQQHLASCGTTFTELINTERCEAADRLSATNPEVSTTEIAARVGYRDTSTFYRAYRRSRGTTLGVAKY